MKIKYGVFVFLHVFRLGIRQRIFAAEIKVIPEPLLIIGVESNGNRPLFKAASYCLKISSGIGSIDIDL